jgi:ABC-type uncharacterized transport system permease subunit
VIGDQGQAVQGRSAAGFQIGLVPHPSQGGAGLVALQVMAGVAEGRAWARVAGRTPEWVPPDVRRGRWPEATPLE